MRIPQDWCWLLVKPFCNSRPRSRLPFKQGERSLSLLLGHARGIGTQKGILCGRDWLCMCNWYETGSPQLLSPSSSLPHILNIGGGRLWPLHSKGGMHRSIGRGKLRIPQDWCWHLPRPFCKSRRRTSDRAQSGTALQADPETASLDTIRT